MSRHVKLSELGKGTRVVPVRDGATLQEVLDTARSMPPPNARLSQNGRRAKLDDPALDRSHVLVIPPASHG